MRADPVTGHIKLVPEEAPSAVSNEDTSHVSSATATDYCANDDGCDSTKFYSAIPQRAISCGALGSFASIGSRRRRYITGPRITADGKQSG